jgi:inner membrane protein
VDNLAHALAGAALGRAGLKKQTGLATATLVIAANLPDVDAISGVFERSLAWRRGWTHGPIGLAVLPIVLVLAMLLFDRWQARRGTRPRARQPVRPGWLLALAYIGILSHPLLDLLNTYGVRLLMPFSERWFYGDALFIIDVWLWIALALGVYLSRRRERRGELWTARPAVAAIVAVAVYAGAMVASGVAAERYVTREIVARGMRPVAVLASPVPINPFRRRIVFDTGAAFGFGDLRWTPAPHLTLEGDLIPTNMAHPAIAAAAARERRVSDFLYWSRFPFAEVRLGVEGAQVTIGDARYNRRPGDGVFIVRATVDRAPR